jgi:hypothetical protein
VTASLRAYLKIVGIGLGAMVWFIMWDAHWFAALRNANREKFEWVFLLVTLVALIAAIRHRWGAPKEVQ